MSGIEWRGERWAGNDTDANLRVYLRLPESSCERAAWSFNMYHMVRPDETKRAERWISIEITELHFPERDWRRFENFEIRATPKWHAAHEETDDNARLIESQICVSSHIDKPEPGTESPFQWIGHDFTIRFGRRDGLVFPCEIDGWLMPSEEYYRDHPETEEEVQRFAEGPPNLRVMVPVTFEGGSVCVPRSGPDPLPLALKYIKEEIGCDEIYHPQVEWNSRYAEKDVVKMPGWGSSVNFCTQKRDWVTPPAEPLKTG